jgi:hypothetical protein
VNVNPDKREPMTRQECFQALAAVFLPWLPIMLAVCVWLRW